MKKLTGIILAGIFALSLSGCTGWISGYEYDVAKVYKVVKGGVTTFMTEEEIKEKNLDKAGYVIEGGYKIVKEGNGSDDSNETFLQNPKQDAK